MMSEDSSQINEVHFDDNHIFDNVNHQLAQEIHQEEHLGFDDEEHSKVLELEAEVLKRQRMITESEKRISLLCRGEYSQWVERFMNYLEEQTDGEVMINSIKNGDQPLPRVTQVSIAGTTSTEQPPLKDKSMCNKSTKGLWDALARHMLGSEYGEQDRKAAVLYEYETFKA
nr:hypothetical protein [Tanacetum cinerariifolium]